MPKSRYAARKDANHAEIQAVFERCGCAVLDCSRYDGFVDLLVWRHEARLVEVKSPKGSLTPSQKSLVDKWPGKIHVVRHEDEALALVRAWDLEAAHQLPW